MMMVSRIS